MFLRSMLLVASVLVSGAAFADGQMFAPEEFSKVTDVAVNQFKADQPDQVSMFYGIALTRNVQDGQEVGLLAKIYMQMGSSAPTVIAKYNCHKHETGEIQCHAQ